MVGINISITSKTDLHIESNSIYYRNALKLTKERICYNKSYRQNKVICIIANSSCFLFVFIAFNVEFVNVLLLFLFILFIDYSSVEQ